jgi:hypothetical protein
MPKDLQYFSGVSRTGEIVSRTAAFFEPSADLDVDEEDDQGVYGGDYSYAGAEDADGNEAHSSRAWSSW